MNYTHAVQREAGKKNLGREGGGRERRGIEEEENFYMSISVRGETDNLFFKLCGEVESEEREGEGERGGGGKEGRDREESRFQELIMMVDKHHSLFV